MRLGQFSFIGSSFYRPIRMGKDLQPFGAVLLTQEKYRLNDIKNRKVFIAMHK